MKKIITLMIAVSSFAALHAQTSRDEARRVILGQPKNSPQTSPDQNSRDVILGGGNNGTNYPKSYPKNYPNGSRQAQIDQVNREYNTKIQSIRNNPYLSRAEKDRAIRQLENDRASKIRRINGQYSKYSKKKNKNYHYDDDNNHHDNGKHLGWEKGKGNPHKNGGKHKE
ncbi:MAG: hypothetical protein ACTHOB_01575 [Ginsengibacter sp.]|jgi:hypothetical protein